MPSTTPKPITTTTASTSAHVYAKNNAAALSSRTYRHTQPNRHTTRKGEPGRTPTTSKASGGGGGGLIGAKKNDVSRAEPRDDDLDDPVESSSSSTSTSATSSNGGGGGGGGGRSATSSERAWEEEYQQWKRAQHRSQNSQPQQQHQQNQHEQHQPRRPSGASGTSGSSRNPRTSPKSSSSSSSVPMPTVVEQKQRRRSESHRELKAKLSQAGSFHAEASDKPPLAAASVSAAAAAAAAAAAPSSAPRGARGSSAVPSSSASSPKPTTPPPPPTRGYRLDLRPVSPCIDSTLPSCDEGTYDGPEPPASSSPASVLGQETATDIGALDEDTRDDDKRRSSSSPSDPESSPIPEHFVRHIRAAFGGGKGGGGKPRVDLYRDVLQVRRDANDRELRTAYFKRGRQVLSSSVDTIKYDKAAKRQFQAISMAYEILTNDELRHYYDRHGLVSGTEEASPRPHPARPPTPTATFEALKQQLTNSPKATRNSNNSTPPSGSRPPTPPRSGSPLVRRGRGSKGSGSSSSSNSASSRKKNSRSLSRGRSGRESNSDGSGADDGRKEDEHGSDDPPQRGRRRSKSAASRSIRWNEHVEELVYVRDPEELLAMRRSSSSSLSKSQAPQDALGSALSVMLGEPPLSALQRHQQQYPKLRKVKRKVVLEAQQLAQELEALHDNKGSQERQNFVSYFLDDLEASLDGLEASVEDFWRFAIATAASPDESSRPAPDGKSAGEPVQQPEARAAGRRGRDADEETDDDDDDAVEGGDHADVGREHDTTSIGTEEFEPPPSRSRVSPAPGTAAPAVSAARMDLETTPSLDEEAEQELRSSKILEAFEVSDADSRSSSITSGRARAAEDPALNADRPSVRERVAVLAAAAGHAAFHRKKSTAPSSRVPPTKRLSLPSRSMSDAGDATDSLYDSLMKPHRRSSSTDEALATEDAASALDDIARELFQDLTKPPPSGYEVTREPKRSSFLMKKKTRGKPRSRSCGPSYSNSPRDQHQGGAGTGPFDPFRADDDEFIPPTNVYSKSSPVGSPSANEDAAAAATVSTISASEAPSNLRDRLRAKHRAAAVAGKHRLADTTKSHERESKPTASPAAVQAIDDDNFDVLSGFESQDPNILKLDRTRGSGLSSLTGHASHFSTEQDHAWRHFCATTNRPSSGAETEPLTPSSCVNRGEPPLGGPCNAPSSSDDEDLVSQIMVYMQAFTEKVDSVGLSITNIMTAAVAVPEDNVQGVLNVLSQEMDSSK